MRKLKLQVSVVFCLLSLDVKAGPKNASQFLRAIWKSIFISSHSTLLTNAIQARGTACLPQSLWRGAAAQLAKKWVLSSHAPILVPERLARQDWSQWSGQMGPGCSRHQSAFPSEPFTALLSSLWTPSLSLSPSYSYEWNYEVASLTCSTPNLQLFPKSQLLFKAHLNRSSYH